MRQSLIYKFAALAGAFVVASVGWEFGEAQAQESHSSVNVSATIDPNAGVESASNTEYAGIDQCETLVEGDRTFDVDFEMTSGVLGPDQFGDIFMYERERGASTINCYRDDQLSDDCQRLDEGDYTTTNSGVEARVPFETLTGFDSNEICDGDEIDRDYYIQFRVRTTTTGADTEWERVEGRLIFDLVRPEPPELIDAVATQSVIRVEEFEQSTSSDAEDHFVFYSTEPFDEGDAYDDSMTRGLIGGEDVESGSAEFELTPGATIYVGMMARDRAQNFGFVSAPLELTVIETEGFWDVYKDANGDEQGGYGCQSATTTPTHMVWLVALLLLAAVWWRARRSTTEAPSKGLVRISEREGRRR